MYQISEELSVTIDAEPLKVWKALTSPHLMAQWMAEPDMKLEVQTDWTVGSAISIKGFHHVKFENKGIVLNYIKERRLSYSHLSSVSKLADEIENYAILDFVLTPVNQTVLTVNLSNFPTEVIQKHLLFYWRGAIHKIKACVACLPG